MAGSPAAGRLGLPPLPAGELEDMTERVKPMSEQTVRKTGKAKRAGKSSSMRQPKPHVISLRVSDREKLLLERIGRKRAKNVSAVVREALEHWLAR